MIAPRAVVFDLDGTLVDAVADIALALNHVLVESGRSELPTEVIAGYVGDGARALVARAVRLEGTELDPILRAFLDHYAAHPVVRSRWMPGAREALDELRTLPLALCTNKPREIAVAVLSALGVLDRFSTVVGGGDCAPKPSADALRLVASRLGVVPAQLVMVGDGTQDALAGKAVGARTIAVMNGYGSVEALRASAPDEMVESMHEVPGVMRRWLAIDG